MPKTVIFGARGFLGSRFFAFYRKQHKNAVGTHHTPYPGLLHFDLNLFDKPPLFDATYALLLGGIFDPLKCEHNPEATYFINVTQTVNLGEELVEQGIIPIFFSSNYALEGENHYATQKQELEREALKRFGEKCLIIRCAKIYGTSRGDRTLFDVMALDLMENRPFTAAVDQMLAPIHVDDVIKGVIHLQKENKRGLINCAGPTFISRFDAAVLLAKLLGKDENLVTPISIDAINDGVKRPKGSFLSSEIQGRCLQEGLEEIAKSYG